MKVLVIKLTSMGDVIHALPALTDAKNYCQQELSFDFVVEDAFQEIPTWHSNVDRVIPVATRRWRKNLWAARKEIKAAYQQLKARNYDVIIDAQGLGKSALIARLAKGERHGFDKSSIREPLAVRLYNQSHTVDTSQHAISRIRQLFAHSLAYSEQISEFDKTLDYGLSLEHISCEHAAAMVAKPYIVLLHGTTWLAKEWPTENWQKLAQQLSANYHIVLPWGNAAEQARAKKIAGENQQILVLPRLSISSIAHILAQASGVVSVDTGLGHLSAALGVPTVSIYGPTDVDLIGTRGEKQKHLCAVDKPNWRTIKKNEIFDYDRVSVQTVYTELLKLSA